MYQRGSFFSCSSIIKFTRQTPERHNLEGIRKGRTFSSGPQMVEGYTRFEKGLIPLLEGCNRLDGVDDCFGPLRFRTLNVSTHIFAGECPYDERSGAFGRCHLYGA
jgi:hypothetical protein